MGVGLFQPLFIIFELTNESKIMKFWFSKDKSEPIQTKSTGVSQVIFQGSPFFINLKECNTVTQMYSNKVVYSVTNALVNKLLEVPIIVTTDNSAVQAKYFRQSKSLQPERLWMSKALGITEQTDHVLNDLLDAPNSYQSGVEFRRAFWFNRILSGVAYVWKEGPGELARKKSPTALHVIPSYMIEPIKSGNWKDPISGYRFRYNGREEILKKDDVMMVASWSPDDCLSGFDPMNAAGNTIRKNNINDLAQMAAFQNGGTGILFSSDTVTDGIGNVSDKVSPEDMARLKETIMNEYAGARNNKRMHFTNGFVNVSSFGDTLADLKLIEASETEVKEICAIFNVSPIIIGEGKSNTESNVVQAYKSLVTNNVVPKLREFDSAFNKFCSGWFKGEKVKIAHDITEFAELMPNMELVKKVYGENAAVTLNEYRLMLGLDVKKDPLYDKSYIQSGFVPLEDAGFTNAYTGTQSATNG